MSTRQTALALGLLAALASAAFGLDGPALQGAGAESVAVQAFTTPFRDLAIASEIGGVVTALEVEEGDHAEAGRVLVRLKADVLEAELAVSKARVDVARYQRDAAQASLDALREEWQEQQELLDQKVAAQDDVQKAKLAMDLGQLDLSRFEAQQAMAEYTVLRDQAALEQTCIRAPLDGEILRILRRPGEAVKPLDPVVRFVALDPLYVVAPAVPIGTMGRIQPGMKAVLVIENDPGRQFECTVTVVDRAADPASGTYRVKLTVPNPDRTLPAGAKGTVTFTLTDAGQHEPEEPQHG